MSRSLIWFRRSLRLDDLHAFRVPVERGHEVACVVVKDSKFRIGAGAFSDRTSMYDDALASLAYDLSDLGGKLYVLDGNPEKEIPNFLTNNKFTDLWFAEEIEPDGIVRDNNVRGQVEALGIRVHATDDQYLYPPAAFMTGTGKPYSVFTPFKKRCLSQLPGQPMDAPTSVKWINVIAPVVSPTKPDGGKTFCAIGTASAYRHFSEFCATDINDYKEKRDIPAEQGTSRLSPHLHFGVAVDVGHFLGRAVGGGDVGQQRGLVGAGVFGQLRTQVFLGVVERVLHQRGVGVAQRGTQLLEVLGDGLRGGGGHRRFPSSTESTESRVVRQAPAHSASTCLPRVVMR